MLKKTPLILAVTLVCGVATFAASRLPDLVKMGKQPDNSFIVSTGQRVEPGAIAFDGRPTDLALHPSNSLFAVLGQRSVFLATKEGVIEGSSASLGDGAGFHGLLWSPDGNRLFASVANGTIQTFKKEGDKLTADAVLTVQPEGAKGNPRLGGMAITRDGTRLFVAALNRNAVAEIDLTTGKWVKEYPVQNLPFTVKLTEDEKTLVVSNWGGRPPKAEEPQAMSEEIPIVVDRRGAPASGTISIIERESGATKHVPVGLHPTDVALKGTLAYVANAGSDTISVVDIAKAQQIKTLPLSDGKARFGKMPNALTVAGSTLFVCLGGENALAEINLETGKMGRRPAGYFPMSVTVSADGKTAYVLNTKGNGSVRRTSKGQVGNAHDYQGTVSVLDLNADLVNATAQVEANNRSRASADEGQKLAVYNGAIKHVLYIIKENRTYDEVFGDLPQGNGDPKLCGLGAQVTPNHRAIATTFTLFDNGYVTGTNSADGHAWSTQAVANDYLEHFYTGYRTYPDDGDCAMSIASSGCLWDAAAKKGLSIRVYGEFADDRLAKFTPEPNSWLDIWKDRNNRPHKYDIQVGTRVAGLKKYLHPRFVYWPLLQSDQERADLFIEEYTKFSKADKVPNLMVMSLPCDHTEGLDSKYPKPRSMVADNDLALGRVVEAVSKSPQWKDTCIFVIEDDAQSGPDHVDGHRTVYMAISPYVKRKFVDSSFYTTLSMIHSMELMLGIPPMNQFDALGQPLSACFTNTPDLTPYSAVPNLVRLDDMNAPKAALKGKERYWAEQSAKLDWSGLDRPNPDILNRVVWHSLHGVNTPYPAR